MPTKRPRFSRCLICPQESVFLPSKDNPIPSRFVAPHACSRLIHSNMPRSEVSKLVVLLLTVHGSIAAVLLPGLDPLASSNEASPATFYPLSNDGFSGDNNIIAASFIGGTIPNEALTGQQAEKLLGDPFISNEGKRPQSFILGGISSQCDKKPNGQAQPDDSKRVRPREAGGYCEPDASPGFTSIPQNPTANPPQGSIQQGGGSAIRKNPSAIIPSVAEDPTVNPLLCPNIERMIPVCHGMYEPVLGLGPFELERCSPSM